MNIALIGMPGTMKTSVGKILAKTSGLRFRDTDDIFVREEKKTIAEVFQTKGEAYFREREAEIVRRVASETNVVISCGGGAVLREENVRALRASCTVVLLTATAECIAARTSENNARPLLRNGGIERIRALCAERAPAYASAADFVVDTTDLLPDFLATEIWNRCKTLAKPARE